MPTCPAPSRHPHVLSPSLPCHPAPPIPEAQADYARLALAWDVWDSRDAAVALALTELLPSTEAAHFDLVEAAKEVHDAISARYSTPSSASLSRILMPFVFPDLNSFATISDLATRLRFLGAVDDAAEDDFFMVPEQQRGGKLAPKARWGLHLGVSPEITGREVLDLTDNKVVSSVEVIFYETLLLEVWKAKLGLASRWTQAHPPTDTSTATVALLAEVNEPADEDVEDVLTPPFPVADRPASTPVSATGDEGSLEASPMALASGIAGG
ncbi:unnamed protein product [Closterium sp. NIES-53]